MHEEERKRIIAEKRAEIARLQTEIKELGDGYLATLVNEKFIRTIEIKDDQIHIRESTDGWSGEWKDVSSLASKLFFVKDDTLNRLSHYGDANFHSIRMKQKDMNIEQKKLAAEFCDEVIALHKKYVRKANTFEFDFDGKHYVLGGSNE